MRKHITEGGLIRSLGGRDEVKKMDEVTGQDHIKGDKRILGDSDFASDLLSESEGHFSRGYKLKSLGLCRISRSYTFCLTYLL